MKTFLTIIYAAGQRRRHGWVFESHHKNSELSSKTYVWIRFPGRRTGSCIDCNSGLFWLSAHHDFPSLLSYPDP